MQWRKVFQVVQSWWGAPGISSQVIQDFRDLKMLISGKDLPQKMGGKLFAEIISNTDRNSSKLSRILSQHAHMQAVVWNTNCLQGQVST